MPTIPYEPIQQVGAQGVPDVRVSPSTPPGAFGGGDAAREAFGQAQGLASDIAKQQEDIRQKADLAAVFKATAELSNYATDVQYNPQTGIVAQRGENAFPLAKTVPEGYRKKVSDLMGSLSTPEQRQMFQRQADQHWNELNRFNQSHIAGQSEQFMAQQADAYVASRQNAGALAGSTLDYDGITKAAQDVYQARRVWAMKNGVSQDVADLITAKDVSHVYAGAITSMVNAQKDQAAKQFFDDNKDRLTKQDRDHVERLVNDGSDLGTAQRINDKIFSDYADFATGEQHRTPKTLSEATAELNKETAKLDPKARKIAEQEFAHRWTLMKAIEKDATDKVFEDASHQLDLPENRGKLAQDAIDADTWSQLPDNDRKALIAYSSAIMRPPKEGDDALAVTKWYALTNDDISKMSPADMFRWRTGDPDNGIPPLTKANYDKFAESWSKIRKGEDDLSLAVKQEDRKYLFTNAKNGDYLGMGKVKDLNELGDKKSDDYKEKSAGFEKAFSEILKRMDTAQTDKGKKLSELERREIINNYLLEQPKPQGFLDSMFGSEARKFWGAPLTQNYTIPGGPQVANPQKVDITDAEKQRIRDLRIFRGRPAPSDAKILKMKAAEASGASLEELQRIALEQ